jgi:hypothetical protein
MGMKVQVLHLAAHHITTTGLIQSLPAKEPGVAGFFRIYMEWRDHDNWNGGIDFYDLVFLLNFDDYSQIYDHKETYQDIVLTALQSFYRDETDVIQNVIFAAKIAHFVDWEALDVTETKQTLLDKIENEKEMLIQIGTGVLRIQDVNDQYKEGHQRLCQLLKKICLSNPNTYDDLWDWYNDRL